MEQIVNREQRAVQSVEVGGRLLIALGQHAAPMSLKDLAAAADLPAAEEMIRMSALYRNLATEVRNAATPPV